MVVRKREYGVSFWGDHNVPTLIVVLLAYIYEYTIQHGVVLKGESDGILIIFQ